MEDFYESIPGFTNFNEITESHHFKSLPPDWSVFISDVRGSTKAIAEGKYNEVNMIGAASIVVTGNAMDGRDFPYVFGGDGATLLIPPHKTEAVITELSALKALAKQNFNLDLRVGMVKVAQLYAAGKSLEAGKFELTLGRSIAILRGAGLELAEHLIKRSGEKYEVSTMIEVESDLSGLSCRWLPIPSKNGKILSLIVYSRKDDMVFKDILQKMNTIFPEGIESLNPANTNLKAYKSFWQSIVAERKFHVSTLNRAFAYRVFEILISTLLFKFSLPLAFANTYIQSIQTHTDFRKFDNMLRMVIDCSAPQIVELDALLADKFRSGLIYYGTFQSENSLMTCFVDGLSQGQHIHFMDAENGGYAMAAVELKRQMGQVEVC